MYALIARNKQPLRAENPTDPPLVRPEAPEIWTVFTFLTVHVLRGWAFHPRKADDRAADVLPYIEAAKRAGCTSLQELADALNARGIPSARGGPWHPATVARVIGRDPLIRLLAPPSARELAARGLAPAQGAVARE